MGYPSLFVKRLAQIGLQCPAPPLTRRTFRVNTLKTTPEKVAADLQQAQIKCEVVSWYPTAILVSPEDSLTLLASRLVKEGHLYAQGLESILAVAVLDPQPAECILDLCAAPGSKTSQIAAHMNNQGALAANEAIRARFYRLKAVMELTAARAEYSIKDGRYFRSSRLFDRVLVDAPCSSEGRFRLDEPKTYQFWSLRKIHEMAHKQKGLLLNAGRLVKAGGTLVYSTCTFAPEENEAVVSWFLKKTQGAFRLEQIAVPAAPSYPAILEFEGKSFDPAVRNCLRVRPTPHWEGFFLAKFAKV